jgi:hypothetical protein
VTRNFVRAAVQTYVRVTGAVFPWPDQDIAVLYEDAVRAALHALFP